jgi:hypothetical protein
LSYYIYPIYSKTAITFQHIAITYIILYFGLIIVYLELKFFKWLDKYADKFENWLIKKLTKNKKS